MLSNYNIVIHLPYLKIDIVVYAGGGHINELWWQSIPYMIIISLLVKLRKLKIVLGPSTIGLFYKVYTRLLAKTLLKLIDKIYVREPLSKIVVDDICGKECNDKTYLSRD